MHDNFIAERLSITECQNNEALSSVNIVSYVLTFLMKAYGHDRKTTVGCRLWPHPFRPGGVTYLINEGILGPLSAPGDHEVQWLHGRDLLHG